MFTEDNKEDCLFYHYFDDKSVYDRDDTIIDDDYATYDDDDLLYNENEGLTEEEIQASILEDTLYREIQQAFFSLFGFNWRKEVEYINYFFSLIY